MTHPGRGGASAPPLIVFDLDGTLVDSIPGLADVFYRFLADHGIDDGPALFQRLAGRSIQEIVRILRADYRLEPKTSELVGTYNDRLRIFYRDAPLMRNADEVVRSLSVGGASLALATSAAREIIAPLLDRTGWSGLFVAVACGDEVTRGKPAPDVFRLAQQRAGGGAMIVIEDSSTGIAAGIAAGARVIGFAPAGDGDRLHEAGAESVVSDLRDIPRVVASWNRAATS